MKVSIITLTADRYRLALSSLLSVKESLIELSTLYPDVEVETLVGFNNCPVDEQMVEQIGQQSFQYFAIQSKTPGDARNILVEKAQGEVLLFIDDDIIMPKEYLSNLVYRYDEDPNLIVLGGGEEIYPSSSLFEYSINLALRSPFVTFNTRSRHLKSRKDKKAREEHLTLSNLSIKKEEFLKVGGFDPNYFRNEENFLLQKIEFLEERGVLANDLFVYHKRRAEFYNFLRPSFWSGFY